MRSFLTATLILVPGAVLAQVPEAIQVPETGFSNQYITVDCIEYDYQIYVPRDYQPTEEWPVTLFLHGTEEVGDAGLWQTQAGLGSAIRNDSERWSTLVVVPQLPLTLERNAPSLQWPMH